MVREDNFILDWMVWKEKMMEGGDGFMWIMVLKFGLGYLVGRWRCLICVLYLCLGGVWWIGRYLEDMIDKYFDICYLVFDFFLWFFVIERLLFLVVFSWLFLRVIDLLYISNIILVVMDIEIVVLDKDIGNFWIF